MGRYPNLDLGRDQGTGRGDVPASFSRVTSDGKFECFTFVPDTLHNRVTLMQKQTLEVATLFFGPKGRPAWRKLTMADVEPALAPAVEGLPEGPFPEDVRAASPAEGQGVPPWDASTEAAMAQGPQPPGDAAAEAGEARIEVKDLEDFLALSKRQQVLAVKDDAFPVDALQEVIKSSDSRLSEQAREAALKKVERMTPNAG